VTVTGLRKSWLFWTALLLAVAMLILMLIPAELWHHPPNDAVYRGFDRELVVPSQQSYPAPEQGLVDISPGSLKLTALPNSHPAVTLLTTPLRSFRAVMDVRVLQNPEASEPLRIGIWSARTKAGQFLVFGPGNVITEETVQQGGASHDPSWLYRHQARSFGHLLPFPGLPSGDGSRQKFGDDYEPSDQRGYLADWWCRATARGRARRPAVQ